MRSNLLYASNQFACMIFVNNYIFIHVYFYLWIFQIAMHFNIQSTSQVMYKEKNDNMRQLNALYVIMEEALFGFTCALVLINLDKWHYPGLKQAGFRGQQHFPSQNRLFCSGTAPVWVPASCWWKRGKNSWESNKGSEVLPWGTKEEHWGVTKRQKRWNGEERGRTRQREIRYRFKEDSVEGIDGSYYS